MVERTRKQEPATDIIIAGAGYVGLATAVALKSSAPHLGVTVIDAAPAGVWRNDTRASAIAAAASRMLDRLGCWDAILPEAQPINEMTVTDSRTADPVRPVFLTFNGESSRVNPSRIWWRTASSMRRCAPGQKSSALASSKGRR